MEIGKRIGDKYQSARAVASAPPTFLFFFLAGGGCLGNQFLFLLLLLGRLGKGDKGVSWRV
jgi:hypothetical protein